MTTMPTCCAVDCDNPSVTTATLGFGPENDLLTVTHEIACPLCGHHRDARLDHHEDLTLDPAKLDLPAEILALWP